jgi:hypothetical protein
MDDTNPEWNSREKAQKAQEIRVFAPFVPFCGYSGCVLSRWSPAYVSLTKVTVTTNAAPAVKIELRPRVEPAKRH